MNQNAQTFRRRFLSLIAMTWALPPVFGFAFLGYIEIFTPAQIIGIVTAPLMIVFVIGTLVFCLRYFERYIRPLTRALDGHEPVESDWLERRLKGFALRFWLIFLGYLLLAPAITILSAEWHTDFVAQPVDWFRIHLVALIVSIIVGLPIFFTIFDHFGRHFGHIALQRPVLTVRTRVFLIGALSPLLIDTMLVQYYWTRTGFFTHETFIIWLLLEVLAIAGALLFMRSFSQALAPLQTMLVNPDARTPAASTEELGIFARRLDQLLDEQYLHRERLTFSNHLLRESRTLEGLGELLETIIERTRQALGCDMCFLSLYDPRNRELVGVIHTGAPYRPEGHYRIGLDETALSTHIFRTGQACSASDIRQTSEASPRMVERFGIRASAGVPLMAGDRTIGVLHAAHLHGPHVYTRRELRILDAFAQEAALAHAFFEDQRLRRDAETAIRQITEAIASAIGNEFFPVLARAMADILAANAVAIGVLADDDASTVETLAFYLDGELIPDVRYPLAGTPCAGVVEAQQRRIVENVQQLFPENEELSALDLHSYIGIPLFDSQDRLQGILFAMFRDVPANADFTTSVMEIFAARAAAEIERLRVEERIKHLAYHDSLTGLPNRELFMDRLATALAHARRSGASMAIILMDLDHFKDINDSLGHPLGDRLLQEVADRLRGAVRHEDTVARLGGDEFIVLLNDIGAPNEAMGNASRVVEKLRRHLAPGYTLDGHSLMVTTSLGIAIHPDDGDTAEQLIKHADTALYQAKGAGRNTYRFFSPAMNAAAVERLRMETELRAAIEKAQFELLFQPKVAIADGRLLGAEVLLRWPHPAQGYIPPDRFIPVAEETGLIVPLGEWVIEQACRYTTELWCQHGCCGSTPSLSINVSPRQFAQPDFVERLQGILTEHATKPGCIELEITENLLIQDIADIERKLDALKEMGVNISIDDFGTGYSSLRYLQRLPIDTIKIDQTFVHNIAHNRNDAVIVETIIAMARHLGLHTIAEGVETRDQLAILASRGCNAYQGYIYSPPMPIAAFRELLRDSLDTATP